jgi:peptidoglycan/LPS O-acetylase OafA/YrhL
MRLLSNPSAPESRLPKSPKYLSLDIWRGFACLAIVMLHASFYSTAHDSGSARFGHSVGESLIYVVSRMGIGVHIFFVISGYCIAATADSTSRKPRAMMQYFKRRFRRIFPPYWAALALTILTVLVASILGYASLFSDHDPIPQPATLTTLQWLGNLTLTETWRCRVFPLDPSQLQLGPAWSLCYEEQFYAVCGLVLLVCPRRFFAGCAAVSFFTLCLAPLTILVADSPLRGFFFDGKWLLFAAGILVYYQVNYASGKKALLLFLLLALGFLGSVAFRYGLMSATGGPSQKELAFEFVIGSAFALLLLLLHRWDQTLSGMVILQPIAFCGRMCYSLYLIHWPIAKTVSHSFASMGVKEAWPTLLLTIPVSVILSIGASWIFYILIERRFLNAPSQVVTSSPVSPRRFLEPVLVPQRSG